MRGQARDRIQKPLPSDEKAWLDAFPGDGLRGLRGEESWRMGMKGNSGRVKVCVAFAMLALEVEVVSQWRSGK